MTGGLGWLSDILRLLGLLESVTVPGLFFGGFFLLFSVELTWPVSGKLQAWDSGVIRKVGSFEWWKVCCNVLETLFAFPLSINKEIFLQD